MVKNIYNNLLGRYRLDLINNNAVLASLCICLVISMLYSSRSFSIGYAVAIVFTIIYLKKEFSKPKATLWLALLFITLFIAAVFIKPDSSLGRLLIYKITFILFKDHWIQGVGLGKFKLTYLYYQEAYFKGGHFTQMELLLADNTQHAFNDYWQFILETGIGGIVILLMAILLIVRLITKALKNNPGKSNLLMFAIAQIVAISIAAIFMHVFERPAFQFILIAAVLIVAAYAYSNKFKLILGVMILSFLSLAYFNWSFYLANYKNYKKLEEAQNLYQAGYISEALAIYRGLYTGLKNDPSYLVKYAAVLSTYDDNNEAENIIQLALTRQCNCMYYNQLAQYYYKNKKLQQAEQAYTTAVFMVPNRFTSRYNLYTFYQSTQQTTKAIQAAKEILALPVKIPSPGIETIKSLVAKGIKEN